MAELYLKNSTGSNIEVADIGLVIEDGQSVPVDENDFDGYLTDDLILALNDNPATGLILSTTDIGDTSGDLTKEIAQERIQMKTHWKPSRADFASFPTVGNENGDIRLAEDEAVLYKWSQSLLEWQELTSTLTVTEPDGDPSGDNIVKLVFVQEEDNVYIDATNRTAYIGPPDPPNAITSQSLVIAGTTLYSGGLSSSNVNYKGSDPAGDIVNYIINDGIFTATTPNSSRGDYGDMGTITVYLNGTGIATLDLGENFDEVHREGNQIMADYDNAGTGDGVSNGIVSFTGSAAGKGNLELLSVGMFNSFKYYQRWSAKINFTDATIFRQGWNEVYITHDSIVPTQTSNKLDVFYDTDAGSNPSVSIPTVTEDTPSFSHLSGVKFYGVGSTWDVDVTGSDCFDNVYHSSGAPLVFSGWPGMSTTSIAFNDASVGGVSNPPDINETMTVSNWNLVLGSNVTDNDARITVTPRDPYGSYTPAESVSGGILVNSFGGSSTELIEYFTDEDYRLLDGTYDSIPGSITSLWDSTGNIDIYDDGKGLQVYLDELYFPTVDFSSNLPSGNPDYSGLAIETDKTYIRAFRDTSASHSNGILRISGVTKTQLYNRDVRVWIKAPTQTGWLDLTRDYNYPTFTGIDDDACWINRSSQSNSDFGFSLGTFGTEFSGDMIIVKVLYPGNTAPRITHLEVTNW